MKKLIPTICMLLVTATLMGTSTYAWFSMNTTVTATGMSVTAKSDAVYLQIQNHGVAFTNDAHNTVATTVEKAALRPTNVYKTFNASTPTAFAGGTDIVWVSNYSNDPASSTKAGDYTNVTDNLTDYALKFSYDIRLKPDTGATTAPGPLKVASVEFENGSANSGLKGTVSVLVVCGANSAVYKQDDVGTFVKKAGDAALTAAAFDNTTGMQVDVYVFFDGDNNLCYTNNIDLDDTFSVKVTFNCDAD